MCHMPMSTGETTQISHAKSDHEGPLTYQVGGIFCVGPRKDATPRKLKLGELVDVWVWPKKEKHLGLRRAGDWMCLGAIGCDWRFQLSWSKKCMKKTSEQVIPMTYIIIHLQMISDGLLFTIPPFFSSQETTALISFGSGSNSRCFPFLVTPPNNPVCLLIFSVSQIEREPFQGSPGLADVFQKGWNLSWKPSNWWANENVFFRLELIETCTSFNRLGSPRSLASSYPAYGSHEGLCWLSERWTSPHYEPAILFSHMFFQVGFGPQN